MRPRKKLGKPRKEGQKKVQKQQKIDDEFDILADQPESTNIFEGNEINDLDLFAMDENNEL